jgi:hypothetical protein
LLTFEIGVFWIQYLERDEQMSKDHPVVIIDDEDDTYDEKWQVWVRHWKVKEQAHDWNFN